MKKINQKGFSLVEILVFTSIVSVFFVVATTVATYSLTVMKSNENKIRATRAAEEIIDWLRGEKEANWTTFSARAGSWCFNNTTPSWDTADNNTCSQYSLQNMFKRDVSLVPDVTGQIRVNVVVSWTEGSATYSVPVNTVFAQIQ